MPSKKIHHDKNSVLSKFNPCGKSTKYEVGDQVWYYRPSKKKVVCPKLQKFWEGPYEVLKKISPILYLVKSAGRKPTVENIGKMKPYFANADMAAQLDFDTLDCFNENRPEKDIKSVPEPETSRERIVKKPKWYGIKM